VQNILLNALSSKSGGALSYLQNLVPLLCRLVANSDGVALHILCDQEQRSLLSKRGVDDTWLVPVMSEGSSTLTRIRWERRRLGAIVREGRYAAVFTPYQVVYAQTHVPQVVMLRNLEPFLHSNYTYSLRGRIRNWLLRQATAKTVTRARHVIAVSEYARKFLIDFCHIPNERITRIYHGRDQAFEGVATAGENGDLRFLTCGSLLPYRRCEDVITAFSKYLVATNRKATLIVAGQGTEAGYRRRLETTVKALNVTEYVEFAGHLSRDDMRKQFLACDACILATEIEACPNIAIEALTSGCVVLAAETPPLREILGDAALFYAPRNANRLSELLEQVSDSATTDSPLRQAARARSAQFSWDECAQQTLAVLVGVAEK
jgi:glycosyltransferase involved in cell wall biosynthesis